jgi:hypothetical protein
MVTMLLWLPCPSRLARDISTRALGDKIKLLMIIYSGVLFLNATWQMLPWQTCCFFYVFAGAKIRREEKKERKLLVSFRIITCNLPFLLYVIILDSFQVVLFFYS